MLVTVPARKEKVERKREAKAEVASNVDREIEKELLSRLQSGTYQDIYNFPQRTYNKVLDEEGTQMELEEEEEPCIRFVQNELPGIMEDALSQLLSERPNQPRLVPLQPS